jgi:hypothetical protein
MSLYSASRLPENSSHQTKPQQRSELKQQIENFLKSAATQSSQSHHCSRCGAEMKKYVDMTFSLMGTSSAWNIKVPVCGCTAENSGRSSSGDTGENLLGAASKKVSAA